MNAWADRSLAWVAGGFLVASLFVYRPAFDGPFISDDIGYVVTNRYIHELSFDNLKEILDPTGVPAAYTANYAPVHMLLHAAEWQFFGARSGGYHVVNAVLHAGVSALLVVLFAAWGIPRAAAVLGGALFLLHPANVEAVAWIFQLKTIASLGLAVGALLVLSRRPMLAAALFALALLTKVSTLFALPTAAALLWVRARPADADAPGWGWLALWGLLLAACALPEFIAFERMGHVASRMHEDPLVVVRSIAAIGARYLAMAATSYGVSTFHDPPPALSPWDPWWLAALGAATLLTWRTVSTLRARSAEAAFWVWAAAAWAPVSQVFPFLYSMGDRYLYFILPGLIGGALYALRPVLERPGAIRGRSPEALALLVGLALLAGGFAFRSLERAAIWRDETTVLLDAARNYPYGIEANLLRGNQAARIGDVRIAADAYVAASRRGFDSFMFLQSSPLLAVVRKDPYFQAAIAEVAGRWIEHVQGRSPMNQAELHVLGLARLARGEPDLAVARLAEALRLGGPWDADVRDSLAKARAALRRAETSPPAP